MKTVKNISKIRLGIPGVGLVPAGKTIEVADSVASHLERSPELWKVAGKAKSKGTSNIERPASNDESTSKSKETETD